MAPARQSIADEGAVLVPSTWQTDLAALLDGPYAGHGGQTRLAQRLGTKPRTIYTWRQGTRAPNTDHRQALAALVRETQVDHE